MEEYYFKVNGGGSQCLEQYGPTDFQPGRAEVGPFGFGRALADCTLFTLSNSQVDVICHGRPVEFLSDFFPGFSVCQKGPSLVSRGTD